MTYSNMDNVPTQTAGTSELLASDWNTYVRDNFDAIKYGHIVVADATAKTNLGNVAEGTMVYQSDNNKVYVNSNGTTANWVEVVDLDNTGGVSDAAAPFLAPVGVLMPYAGASAPSGWLLCDGSAVSRTTYSGLWDVLRNGTSSSPYGNGDGSTTFNVPDMRGRAPVGAGTGTGLSARSRGDSFGTETHALSIAELASHTHTGTTGAGSAHNHTINTATTTGASSGAQRQTNSTSTLTTSSESAHTHTFTSDSTGSGTAHNNMQPSLVANYIIKF